MIPGLVWMVGGYLPRVELSNNTLLKSMAELLVPFHDLAE